MTTSTRKQVLALHDKGESAKQIAAALGIKSISYVYGILRVDRPKRSRKVREKTSELRGMVLGLAAQGIEPARIAFLLQRSCARQYVYRILAEG